MYLNNRISISSKPKVDLLDVEIDNVCLEEVISFIEYTIKTDSRAIISNVNVHALNLSYKLEWFRDFINTSNLVFCDGVGVQVAALLTGQKLNYRFTPPDWINDLCAIAEKNHWSVFLLGAKSGIAEKASENINKRFPNLKTFSYHGYFNKISEQNEMVVKKINDSMAEILLVGMGMPLQESWIKENYHKIPNIKTILPVGALIDYVAETVPRGPHWLTDNGFEWLTRLLIEPKRLWRRYIIGNPLFFLRVFLHRLKIVNPKKQL